MFRPEPGQAYVVVDYKLTLRDHRAYLTAVAQLAAYAVYLRHSAKVIGPLQGCRGRLITLADGAEMEIEINAGEIDAAEDRIRRGAASMAELRTLADVAAAQALETAGASGESAEGRQIAERARRETYPVTSNPTRCGRCSFRQLCPEQFSDVAVDSVAA